MTTRQTFRDLEPQEFGGTTSSPGDSSLDDWYQQVRDIPISELDDGDLSRACRQQLFVNDVVPVVVARLQRRPLAGDIYEGELFAALKSVPIDYWPRNVELAEEVRAIAAEVNQQTDDDDIQRDVTQLVVRL